MDSVQKDIEMMRSFISRKRKEREQALCQKLETARKDFQNILVMIISDFNPDRVYQWGSLLEGRHFQEISDIDVAVSGITDPEVFFRLYTKAEALTSFPLHIVQLETIHPAYAEDILKKGRLVYERPV